MPISEGFCINVVREVVAKGNVILERSFAERHNDVVLLELSQSGSADVRIEEVNGGHTGFG
jgi:hypothetical protein